MIIHRQLTLSRRQLICGYAMSNTMIASVTAQSLFVATNRAVYYNPFVVIGNVLAKIIFCDRISHDDCRL